MRTAADKPPASWTCQERASDCLSGVALRLPVRGARWWDQVFGFFLARASSINSIPSRRGVSRLGARGSSRVRTVSSKSGGLGAMASAAARSVSSSNVGPSSTPHPRQPHVLHRKGRFSVSALRKRSHSDRAWERWMLPDRHRGHRCMLGAGHGQSDGPPPVARPSGRDGEEHRKQYRVARHLQAEICDLLNRDGHDARHGSHTDPVV